MRAWLCGLAVLGAAGAAAAADLKVPSDDYPTIQAAATAAQPGDRILVAKGIYQENVTLNVSNVQVIGKKAMWDGAISSAEGICLSATGDDILVQGFIFHNGSDHVFIIGARARVQKCVFRGAGSNGVEVDGDQAIVTSCQFYWGSSEGVDIDGNDALVEKCRWVNMDSGGVQVFGDGALIQKNTITTVEDDEGIYVSGNTARVLKNKIYNAEGGVEISGNECVVEGNLGYYLGGELVYVEGDDVTIRGNRGAFFSDDEDGIYVEGTGGMIEGNVLTDVVQDGFDLSVFDMEILGNSVQRAGSESDDGFRINGSNNLVEGNRALDVDDDGFYVNGSNNTLRGNLAQNCGGDGFDVAGGTDNVLEDCTAMSCLNEGLDNSGTATDVIGGSYLGNRIDVANDGSFDVFDNNVSFSTGGTGTAPELD